jgi:diguanylate cyclase (GGDEF)-like protein
MTSRSKWTELTVQQLVRYEALFRLLADIQVIEDIAVMSRRIAIQWKYFANVTAWRLVVANDKGFLVIDGFRGEARLTEHQSLSPWDAHHWKLQRPRLVRMTDPLEGPSPPEHLTGKSITEIEALSFMRAGCSIGLLSAAARHEPFSELDNKFIRLFGGHFADRVSGILLRRQIIETLTSKATRDALTGLLNRGAIMDRFGSQLALSQRTGQPLSVIIADIDFFKVINDSYGHLAGDEVLREVSQRLQAQMRGSDNLGRYGGEEFLFVLYPCSAEEAAKAAERSRCAIAEIPIAIEGDAPVNLKVTISLGVSCTGGQENIRLEELIKQADDALYHSKADGRNCVTTSKGRL